MSKQTDKISYVNLVKNVARLGAGSALLAIHVTLLSGCTLIARHVEKRKKLKSAVKSLPYEKQL